jgi:hypothetical protein
MSFFKKIMFLILKNRAKIASLKTYQFLGVDLLKTQLIQIRSKQDETTNHGSLHARNFRSHVQRFFVSTASASLPLC